MNLISKKNILYFLFLLLISLGLTARLVEVINGNYLWGFDHGREYLMVRDIVENKNPILIGTPLGAGSAGIQGIFHGPGYYYFLVLPYILFAGDPYGGVVLMFVFGISVIIVSFLLASRLFGRAGGLLTAALTALSPPLIAQSRSLWSPHPSTLFIVLSFYFSYSFLKYQKNKIINIFLASFFAGFVYHFEFAIAVPMTLALLILAPFVFGKKIFYYLSLLAGFAFSFMPMILFEFRHNFMAINGIMKYLSTPQTGKDKITFLENVTDHFGSFMFNVGNSFPSQSFFPALAILLIIIIPFIYLVTKEKMKEKKLFLIWLSLFPVITFIVLSFLRNTVYSYYLYHLNIIYIVLFTYVVISLYKLKKLKILTFFYFIFIIFLSVASIETNLKMISYDLADYGGDAKIKGKKDAIDYIYKDAKGQEFGLLVFSPPVYTYPYDYLLDWYAKDKYGYLPHKEKKGLFYLLMEVDPSKPWSYKGWQETVIKEGEVISDVTLPSGLLIQKRYKK